MPNMDPKKCPMPSQEPNVRNKNFKEVALGYTEEMAVNEAKRCLQCKNHPCRSGCPVEIDIPGFIKHVAEGDFEAAYNVIAQSSALPAVCGRVCPQEHQCEGKCVRGIKGEAVGIGRLERFVADWYRNNVHTKPTAPAPNGHKVAVIGAGPSGIFCAYELIKEKPELNILMIEKGRPIEKRVCPKRTTKVCVGCKPCSITTGFAGAGAFSDGKLSLSYEVGGDLPTLIGEEFAQELINYTDKIYLEFGADPHVEGIYTGEDIKEIRKNAIHAGLKLVDCPIRHLGTEKAQQLYLAIQNYLADNGVEMLFSTECENIILENEECKGVLIKGPKDEEAHAVYADTVVIGTGRRGADWLEKICAEHHIAHKPGTVDIGVRVECRNEVMEKVNKVLYESKLIGYPKPWKNKVRTFCQNPGGFVAQENYDNDLAVVNGHSFKEKKSENTNLAILVSHNFTEPFNQPIAYAQKVGELTNMLGAGHILVQRYGDILDGKRTWPKELAQSNVKPTLKDAVAGDITAAMPYRAMTNIIEFIKMLDMVVPGFAANETLLYSPELKFYSNKVKMDENLDTNIRGLHCLGDSSGWTRGLMMASVMGVLMGRKLAEKEGC